MYQGDPEEIFPLLAHEDGEENGEDDSEALLDAVYCQIAFLTKAYREVMVLFYLDGLSTAEIAVRQNTSDTAIRQWGHWDFHRSMVPLEKLFAMLLLPRMVGVLTSTAFALKKVVCRAMANSQGSPSMPAETAQRSRSSPIT